MSADPRDNSKTHHYYEFINVTAKNLLQYEIENDHGNTELFRSYFFKCCD